MNDIRNSGGTPPSRSFRLDKHNAKLAGVCSGIGNYFNIDPLLVRIAFVLAVIFGFGTPVLIYAAIALIAD
jgi:phage shock protein PspC (stress-responsive transcriptional regulator)